jgi:hypothetical protein
MVIRLQRKAEPARGALDPETMVVCTESFRPGYIANEIRKGMWLPLGHPTVQASKERFAIPLSQLEGRE